MIRGMEDENTMSSRDESATSPSHEFSFTIPLEANTNKAESREPPTAIDLAPADEIFLHGHLLPLHLLNTLPHSHITCRRNIHTCICNNCGGGTTKAHSFNSHEYESRRRSYFEERRVKSKSFSVLTLHRTPQTTQSELPQKHKWKLRFDVRHFVKKYIRMFSSREDIHLRGRGIRRRKQPYSFSTPTQAGKLNLRGRRGEFSAPASIRTSPANSGTIKQQPTPPPSTDSTMEELQAAIQAAIAHCKNSSATA